MKHNNLIIPGIEKDLSTVAFHHDGPLKRYELLQKSSVNGDGGFRVVTHIISDPPLKVEPYCELHYHDFDEINLILSDDSSLKYRITLDDEEYEVSSPSTVYIPKGVRHAAEVISGRGIFVAITFTKNYVAKQ